MQTRRERLVRVGAVGALLGAVLVGVAWSAEAAETDRATSLAVLTQVDAHPKKNLVTEMTSHARAALGRADRLRASGDENHARLAEGLARTWAEAARDVLKAAELEERAAVARQAAVDAGVIADRERALLEEASAQSGRLKAQLEAGPAAGKDQPARTSAAANADAPEAPKAGAKPKAPVPAKKGGGK